ncbi:GNAT family N-acetyltransferase [Oligoflexus tunisiensis]|uniref:GNAT family N-acetyltransferase n=1 Tax=Oligoflexus tunisiensis TaxID=708132 RepID=UPI00159F19EB|nr:GNAT family N-acetyltransferase [Oligoflexus tunisiensis]
MTLVVRPLMLEDAAATARLHNETWRDTYRGLMPDSRLDALDDARTELNWRRILTEENPKNRLANFGVFRDGELLGFGSAGAPREDWGYESELWVINIPRRFQKMGAGKALMQACVQHALGLAAQNMYLYCMIGNDNAMQFYHHLGAVDTDRIKAGDGYQERALVWDDLNALAARLF